MIFEQRKLDCLEWVLSEPAMMQAFEDATGHQLEVNAKSLISFLWWFDNNVWGHAEYMDMCGLAAPVSELDGLAELVGAGEEFPAPKRFRAEISRLNWTIVVRQLCQRDSGLVDRIDRPASYKEIDEIITAWNSKPDRFRAQRRPGCLTILEHVEGRVPSMEPVTHEQLREILAAWNEGAQ